jgi:hypothetical protein
MIYIYQNVKYNLLPKLILSENIMTKYKKVAFMMPSFNGFPILHQHMLLNIEQPKYINNHLRTIRKEGVDCLFLEYFEDLELANIQGLQDCSNMDIFIFSKHNIKLDIPSYIKQVYLPNHPYSLKHCINNF